VGAHADARVAPPVERQPAVAGLGRTLGQFLAFGLIGGSGVLVNLLVVIACKRTGPGVNAVLMPVAGTPYSVRWYHVYVLIAFVVANVWNFTLNRRLTFRANRHMGVWKQFWPFFLVGLAAQAVGLVIITLLMNPTSPLHLSFAWMDDSTGLRTRFYWAQLVSIAVVTPLSFVANKLWSFAVRRA